MQSGALYKVKELPLDGGCWSSIRWCGRRQLSCSTHNAAALWVGGAYLMFVVQQGFTSEQNIWFVSSVCRFLLTSLSPNQVSFWISPGEQAIFKHFNYTALCPRPFLWGTQSLKLNSSWLHVSLFLESLIKLSPAHETAPWTERRNFVCSDSGFGNKLLFHIAGINGTSSFWAQGGYWWDCGTNILDYSFKKCCTGTYNLLVMPPFYSGCFLTHVWFSGPGIFRITQSGGGSFLLLFFFFLSRGHCIVKIKHHIVLCYRK